MPATVAIPNDFSFIGKAFVSLFNAKFDEFFKNLLLGAPAIGVFLIVFMLISFVLRISLMKESAHKSYANWIGIGAGLIAVVNPSVYNAVKSIFGGFLLWVILILTAIYILYALIHKGQASHWKGQAAANRAHADSEKEKRGLQKEHHEGMLSRKLENRERDEIVKSEKLLGVEMAELNTAEKIIQHIRSLLQAAASLGDEGDSEKNKKAIMSQASALAGMINKSYAQVKKIRLLSKQEKKLDLKELHLEGAETATLSRVKAALRAKIHDKKAALTDVEQNEKIKAFEGELKNLVEQAHTALARRAKIIDEATQFDAKELAQLDHLENASTDMAHAADNANFPQALSSLNSIENGLRVIKSESDNIRAILAREQQLDNEVRLIDRKMQSITQRMLNSV